MTMAKELIGGGISAGQAQAMGGQNNTVAATGSTQGDAAALNASNNLVSGADGTKGVTLTAAAGDEVWVFNNAASTLKVYPPVGGAIAVPGTGTGTTNAAFSHLTFKVVQYKFQTNTQVYPLVTA
jgi:hypothetical protein